MFTDWPVSTAILLEEAEELIVEYSRLDEYLLYEQGSPNDLSWVSKISPSHTTGDVIHEHAGSQSLTILVIPFQPPGLVLPMCRPLLHSYVGDLPSNLPLIGHRVHVSLPVSSPNLVGDAVRTSGENFTCK